MWNLEIAQADACWSRKAGLLSVSRKRREAAYRATRPAAVSASARSSSCQRLGTEQQLEPRRRLERREDGGTQLKVGDDEIVDADRGDEHEESFPGER